VGKEIPSFRKLFRQVFRKAAYCIGCSVCETNCVNGFISFAKGLKISDKCVHCHECHNISNGCLAYDSLKIPKGEREVKTINCFDAHAPKGEWFVDFFREKDNFFEKNTLGTKQIVKFKRFLREAELIENNKFSSTAQLIEKLGWKSESAWGIIITNLAAHNPQIQWYIKNLNQNRIYQRKLVEDMLVDVLSVNTKIPKMEAGLIVSAFGRLADLPLGKSLGFAQVGKENDRIVSLSRGTWRNPEPRVILYALYKFAEACEGYYQFSLSRLMDASIESDGSSPALIFGLDRDTMESILRGLGINYPGFISVAFTHDLETISLVEDRKAAEVLALF
jgi:phosphoadenosine phosphosulfate reductase